MRTAQAHLVAWAGSNYLLFPLLAADYRKLGLIEYNGELRINSALLSVVLHD